MMQSLFSSMLGMEDGQGGGGMPDPKDLAQLFGQLQHSGASVPGKVDDKEVGEAQALFEQAMQQINKDTDELAKQHKENKADAAEPKIKEEKKEEPKQSNQ